LNIRTFPSTVPTSSESIHGRGSIKYDVQLLELNFLCSSVISLSFHNKKSSPVSGMCSRRFSLLNTVCLERKIAKHLAHFFTVDLIKVRPFDGNMHNYNKPQFITKKFQTLSTFSQHIKIAWQFHFCKYSYSNISYGTHMTLDLTLWSKITKTWLAIEKRIFSQSRAKISELFFCYIHVRHWMAFTKYIGIGIKIGKGISCKFNNAVFPFSVTITRQARLLSQYPKTPFTRCIRSHDNVFGQFEVIFTLTTFSMISCYYIL
jgi:hypothetical protein